MSLAEYDAFVEALVRANVAPEAARRTADQRFGGRRPDPEEARAIERASSVLEKAEQAEVVKRFRVCGFTPYNLSQARASKIAIGMPDLWLMHPERGVALYWETKRLVGGRFSPEQLAFAAACDRCHVHYGSGHRHDAEQWLVDHGLAELDGPNFYPRAAS